MNTIHLKGEILIEAQVDVDHDIPAEGLKEYLEEREGIECIEDIEDAIYDYLSMHTEYVNIVSPLTGSDFDVNSDDTWISNLDELTSEFLYLIKEDGSNN